MSLITETEIPKSSHFPIFYPEHELSGLGIAGSGRDSPPKRTTDRVIERYREGSSSGDHRLCLRFAPKTPKPARLYP